MQWWRYIGLGVLLALGSIFYPLGSPAFSQENTDPNPDSVVPAEFAGEMDWSEQGDWHWVKESYSGNNVTSGVPVEQPYFVATRVRTLGPEDPCTDCVSLDANRQGPPSIMGGPDNERLAAAYDNLDNGPRYKIAGESEESQAVWAAGSWYLNYNPTTDTFFSWTWIPASEEDAAAADPDQAEPPEGEPAASLADVPEGSRVFPLAAGAYQISQNFGCVPPNNGYATSAECPPARPSFHNGVDFAAAESTPIYAAASGTVVYSGIESSSGNGNSVITIQHDDVNIAFRTDYLHWSESFVEPGDYVHAGQQIAEIGSIGYSSGPHLHFSVKGAASGVTLDPIAWLESSVTPSATEISVNSAAVMNVLRWEPMMQSAAERNDVPIALIAAVITIESSGNPNAVSPAGAQGLMQIMPMHLERYGISEDMWLDPATNIDAGTRYLAESLSDGKSVQESVARYFGDGCDVLGTCTGQYVTLVMSWYAYYSALFAGDPLPPIVDIPVTSPPPSQPEPEAPSEPEESEESEEPLEESDEDAEDSGEQGEPPEASDESEESPESPAEPGEGAEDPAEQGDDPEPTPTETPTPSPEQTATPEPEQNVETPTEPGQDATPSPESGDDGDSSDGVETQDEPEVESEPEATPEADTSEPEQDDGSESNRSEAEEAQTPTPTEDQENQETESTPGADDQQQQQVETQTERREQEQDPTEQPQQESENEEVEQPEDAESQNQETDGETGEPDQDQRDGDESQAEQEPTSEETNPLSLDAVVNKLDDTTEMLEGSEDGGADGPDGSDEP